MIKRVVNLIILIALAAVFWFLDWSYGHPDLEKGFYSFLALSISYAFFNIGIRYAIIRRVEDYKTRYTARKTVTFTFYLVSVIILLRIWLPNPEALLVSYGLIGAGVAIAMQDFFKNIVGGIILFFGRTYRVGDRITINGTTGDVVDISVLYTTLLELQSWVDGDQTTGRLVTVPNGALLSKQVDHYTKDHYFIWDEIQIPITYGSDWQRAISLLKGVVARHTKKATEKAREEMPELRKKYYMDTRDMEPDIYLKTTDNWIMLSIRYVALARERRILHNELSKALLQAIEESAFVDIASSSVAIVDFPEKALNPTPSRTKRA